MQRVRQPKDRAHCEEMTATKQKPTKAKLCTAPYVPMSRTSSAAASSAGGCCSIVAEATRKVKKRRRLKGLDEQQGRHGCALCCICHQSGKQERETTKVQKRFLALGLIAPAGLEFTFCALETLEAETVTASVLQEISSSPSWSFCCLF